MLHENIRRLRSEQGMSQEGLAERLHVVRQTVSKWEKGLSVPDAEMLLRLSEVFGVTVGDLLGETEALPKPENDEPDLRQIAAQLSELNDRFAARAARNRKILRIAAWVVLGAAVLVLLWNGVGELVARYLINQSVDGAASSMGIIGGADGPTAVFVTHTGRSRWTDTLATFAIIAVAGVALWKTKE